MCALTEGEHGSHGMRGSEKPLKERRRFERNRVALPVEMETGSGTSCDISGSGVCFETVQPFMRGAPIAFTVTLQHAFPEGPIRFGCHGKVVRVEQGEGKIRVAASINYYTFPPGVVQAILRAAEESVTKSRRARKPAARAAGLRARGTGD